MKPYFEAPGIQLWHGDTLAVLRQLPDRSINCCVTSPPYWGLRDYGVDGQIGLEQTPEEYVARMVEVFSEVRRVLRDDGTLWLNLGDSYTGSAKSGGENQNDGGPMYRGASLPIKRGNGIKPKDLCGIPWRVAFALQADGWYLRQDIIWHKPNPMPESVTDRCTKAHEYVFLLAKSQRYYYDAEVIKEDSVDDESIKGRRPRNHHALAEIDPQGFGATRLGFLNGRANQAGTKYPTRNRRSVWTVTTKPYSGAHFATFPPDLIEPMILAGCPEGGTVLDPFFGSGTTGQVAMKHFCKCIGIELNPAYCDLAIERLLAQVEQPRLFEPTHEPMEQPDLFPQQQPQDAKKAGGE